MLKKAGIVVALTAACALSVSPLAFAGDYKADNDTKSDNGDHKSHHRVVHRHVTKVDEECAQDNSIDNSADQGEDNTNIVNIQNNTLQANPQVCGNQIADGIVVGILGKATNKLVNR